MSPREVKRLRKRLNLSQAGLARLLGCRANSVYRWEAGIHPPSEPHSRLMALALKIDAYRPDGTTLKNPLT
jgi:DNA-binding transcriptional regulator YiaG